jgi:hypothetical protein
MPGQAFLKQSKPDLQQWLAGRPDAENCGLALASDTEAYAGRVAKARVLTQRAVDSAMRADNKESGAVISTYHSERPKVSMRKKPPECEAPPFGRAGTTRRT